MEDKSLYLANLKQYLGTKIKQSDIAASWGLSVGTVAYRFRTALRMICEELRQRGLDISPPTSNYNTGGHKHDAVWLSYIKEYEKIYAPEKALGLNVLVSITGEDSILNRLQEIFKKAIAYLEMEQRMELEKDWTAALINRK